MAYLDETGLARFWYDIKQWIASALSNLVHRTGHEDITGRKVFNTSQYYDSESSHNILVSRPILRTLDFARGDAAPAEDKYVSLDMVDNTYDIDTPYLGTTRLGGLDYIFRTSGERTLGFTLLNPQNANIKLLLGYDASGVAFASAPSTSSQRNNATDIVTRDWIPNDTRIVHTSGDENITGAKYFNSNVYVKHPDLVKGTNPSSTAYRQFSFIEDADSTAVGSRVGCVENFVATDGSTETSIRAYNFVANSTTYERIAIVYPKNGTPYTYAPTPSAVYDNSTKIATTAWAFPRLSRFYDSATSATLDLNDFITPGVYTFSGYTDAGTGTVYKVANIPEGVNGVLLVIGNSNYVVRQVWFRLGTNNLTDHKIFVRQRNWLESNSWSAWTRLFTDKDTIPVANGGTGQTSVANIQAGKDGSGNTISSTYLKLSGGTMTGVITKNGDLARSGNASGSIALYNGTSASDGAGIWLYGKSHSTRPGWLDLQASDGTDYYSFIIEPNNKYARFTNKLTSVISDASAALGSTNKRWGVLYTTGNVNVGSDERIKQQIGAIPDKVLDAWADVDWCQFKLNAEVESGGDGKAVLHTGLVAQKIGGVLSAAGVDPMRYGFIDHAEWDAVQEQRDEDGSVVVPASPAGDEYSICYVEALCIEAAYQRRENARLKERIAALEERLAALETK